MTGPYGTTVTVIPAAELPGPLRGALHRLFDETYAQADHSYLDNSLGLLRLAAVATADDAPLLVAGRMAHPASLKIMHGNPGALPRPQVVPTAFQQDDARAVACCFAVDEFDPLTFVCRGRGRPIGYPRMADADAQEWKLFAGADRDRGDSLLACPGSRTRRPAGESRPAGPRRSGIAEP